MKITKKMFIEMTGRKPQDDDLERCNCNLVGNIGHWSCGICLEHNKPRFECGCNFVNVSPNKRPTHLTNSN